MSFRSKQTDTVNTLFAIGTTLLVRPAPATLPAWQQAEFMLDAKTVAELRSRLAAVHFWTLKKEYDADVQDGTQRWAKAEASGKQKRVYCNNYFPPEFKQIYTFVEDSIIKAHASAIRSGAEVAR